VTLIAPAKATGLRMIYDIIHRFEFKVSWSPPVEIHYARAIAAIGSLIANLEKTEDLMKMGRDELEAVEDKIFILAG
jgi:hypothetical protein